MRERNGWTDNGRPLKNSKTTCPNCGRNTYKETLSREHCTSCGMECDYWGGGANATYNAYHQSYQDNLTRRHREHYNTTHGLEPGDDDYWDD